MDRIEELERNVRSLSIAVRLLTAVVIAAFALGTFFVLGKSANFQKVLASMLAEHTLPAMTRFVLEFARPIAVVNAAVGLLAIIALFTFSKKAWCIPVAVFVAIIGIAVAQLATVASQLPLLKVISVFAK
jgi:hypothetical protein